MMGRGGAQGPSGERRRLLDDELMMIAGLVFVLATVILLVVRG